MSQITEGKNEWKREGRLQWLTSSYSSVLHGFDSCSCLAYGKYQKDIYPIQGVSSGRAKAHKENVWHVLFPPTIMRLKASLITSNLFQKISHNPFYVD